MDKLPSREIILTIIFCIAFSALVMQIVQCITVGLMGGIPEEEAEDENTN